MREWTCEDLVGSFRLVRTRAVAVLAIVVVCAAAVSLWTYFRSTKRFQDPVPRVLEQGEIPLRAKIEYLQQIVDHPSLHPSLKELCAGRLESARDVQVRFEALATALEGAAVPGDVPFDELSSLRASWAGLEEFRSERDLTLLDDLVAAIHQAISDYEGKKRTWESEEESRRARIEAVLEQLEARVNRHRTDWKEFLERLDVLYTEEVSLAGTTLSARNRSFDEWCRGGELLADRGVDAGYLSQVEGNHPSLEILSFLDRLRVASETSLADRHTWTPQRRLEVFRSVQENAPRRLLAAVRSETTALELLAGDILVPGEPSSADPPADGEVLGVFVSPGDLAGLRRKREYGAAVREAGAFVTAAEAIPEEHDPWSYLVALGRVSKEHFDAVGEDDWRARILLLDEAVTQGSVPQHLPAYLRLARIAPVFLHASGREWIEYIGSAEGSRIYRSLSQTRPFCELGSLVEMISECLEGLNARLQEREKDWQRWRYVVTELLTMLQKADRNLAEAAVAASEPVNRGADKGFVRAEIYGRHRRKAEVATLRARWNENVRRYPDQSAGKVVGESVFQLVYAVERDLGKRLEAEPVIELSRPGVPLATLHEAIHGLDISAPRWSFPAIPVASVRIQAGEVATLIENGVPRETLRRWSSEKNPTIEEGFALAAAVPLEVDSDSTWNEKLALRVSRADFETIPLKLEDFEMSSEERYGDFFRVTGIAVAAILLVLLVGFRTPHPKALQLVPTSEGSVVLRGEGKVWDRIRAIELRDPGDGDVLATWKRGGTRDELRLRRIQPEYPLQFDRRGRRSRKSRSYRLRPLRPQVDRIEDHRFVDDVQHVRLEGRYLTSRMKILLGGRDVTEYRLPLESFSHATLALPRGLFDSGPHDVVLVWIGGEVPAGRARIGEVELVRSGLRGFYFCDGPRVRACARLVLGNDRETEPRMSLRGEEGEIALDVHLQEHDEVECRRVFETTFPLRIGKQVLAVDTATGRLEREIRVFDARQRFLAVVVRESGGQIRLRFLPYQDDGQSGQDILAPQSLSRSSSIVRAVFSGELLYLVGTDSVTAFIPGRRDEEPMVFTHHEPVSDYEHLSFARKNGSLFMGLSHGGGRGSKLIQWQTEAPSEPHEVQLADMSLLEIAALGGKVYYIARNEVREIDAPDEVWRTAGTLSSGGPRRELLRLFATPNSLMAVDLQYRLRDLSTSDVCELANLAGKGTFIDPARILWVDRRPGGLDLLVLDASSRDRLLAFPLDATTRTFARERATTFEFEGTILAARTYHGEYRDVGMLESRNAS